MIAAAVVSLNGEWQLQGWPTPDRGSVRTLEEVPAETISVPAKVPGCYELDLCAAGMLPDLFYANNQYAVRKYEGHQWLYSRKFTLGKVALDEKAFLEFDGLDTLCDVFVNGRKVGEAADMFIPHAFDVTKFVREGENDLAVLFRSPVVESQFSEIAAIGNAGSTSELEAFRKPAHMIGWDILPRFISAGIFRDARVVVRRTERIRDYFCAQLDIDVERRSAQYMLDLRLEGPFRRLDTSEIEVTVSRKGKVVARPRARVYHWTPRVRFGIKDADLWWPLGFGEPALYDVKVEWRDIATKEVLSEKSFRLGVRKLEFILSDYDIATKKPGEMKFVVNGKPCFMRGTSWVPVDALHCRDKDRIIPTLELVREANCNMIRVWGGGLYEPEMFWDWCDENGVLVWQDFCFACTQYPQNNTALHELLRKETIEVVKRLRNHASLALWCGNNENDLAGRWSLWDLYRNPNKDRNSRRTIPDVLYEFDVTRPYLPSSPYVSQDVWDKKAKPAELHMWARKYYRDDYYLKSPCWFSSEIGCHGCPNRASLEKMFSPDKVYPWTDGTFDSWNDEWNYKSSNPFMRPWHNYRNPFMVKQILTVFDSCSRDLDTFIWQSQFVQAEANRTFIENFRAGKFKTKGGIVWWNLRDGWPIISDGIVDYYYNRKRAYDAIKSVQGDQLVLLDDAHRLIAVNDTLAPVSGKVKAVDVASGKTLFDGACDIPANGKMTVTDALPLSGQGMLKIVYTFGGVERVNRALYGEPPFRYSDYL
jgi:beta-mannosidase